MDIKIVARKTVARDPFKERVEKKLSKLDRFFDEDAMATVTVTNEHERETVEVTVRASGMVFRAEKTTGDRVDSLEAVVDSLFKQIVKNKTKLAKRIHQSAFDVPMEDTRDIAVDAEEYQVVKTKRFAVKPMDVQEAILQMNLVGHAFYVFRNAVSNEVCVVYKRQNGDYGLIEPTEE